MAFDENGHSIAYSTAHTLTLTANTVDISSKDHGQWGASDVNKLTFELTTENLYTEDAYDDLFDKWLARKPVVVYFGMKKEMDETKTVHDGDLNFWSGAKGYYGRAVISSLVANANTGENATFSATFTGYGKLQRIESIPATSTASVQTMSTKASTTKA